MNLWFSIMIDHIGVHTYQGSFDLWTTAQVRCGKVLPNGWRMRKARNKQLVAELEDQLATDLLGFHRGTPSLIGEGVMVISLVATHDIIWLYGNIFRGE